MTWLLGPSALSGAISTSVNTLWSGSVSDPASFEAPTLIRIRGRIQALLLTAAAAGDGFTYAFGLALVENTAFTAGATSLPGPISEADWDGWIWHLYGQI